MTSSSACHAALGRCPHAGVNSVGRAISKIDHRYTLRSSTCSQTFSSQIFCVRKLYRSIAQVDAFPNDVHRRGRLITDTKGTKIHETV